MKLIPVAANQTELELANGVTVFFSYKTPVACHIPGEGYFKTDCRWSVTTSRHISKFLVRNGAHGQAIERPQSFFDNLSDRYGDDMFATFNCFEIEMTKNQALGASHPGQCDADVEELCGVPKIRRQLDRIGADKIREELREYGAWDDAELADDEQNRRRIVWIAAGNIADGQ